MKVYLKRTLEGFKPANQEAVEAMRKIKIGDVRAYNLVKPRNYLFLKKFFVMLKIVFENQDVFVNIDELLDRIKLDVGVVKQTKSWTGEISYKPGSISFAKMNNEGFELFYSNAIDCILMNLMTGTTREEIDRQVEEVLRFT